MPLLLPCLADVGRASTELEKAFELGVLIAVGGVDVDVQPGFPLLRLIPATEDDRRLRTAEPFARPDLTEPSSSRSSTTKSRTSHQNRASTSGSRQPSTSSLIRHAMNETSPQPGNCREGHTRTSWLPAAKTIPRPYRTRRARTNDFRARRSTGEGPGTTAPGAGGGGRPRALGRCRSAALGLALAGAPGGGGAGVGGGGGPGLRAGRGRPGPGGRAGDARGGGRAGRGARGGGRRGGAGRGPAGAGRFGARPAGGDLVPGLLDLVGGLVGDLLDAGSEVARGAVEDLLDLRLVEQLAGAGGDLLVALAARLGAQDVADRGADHHAELAHHLHLRPPSPSGGDLACRLADVGLPHLASGRRRDLGHRPGGPGGGRGGPLARPRPLARPALGLHGRLGRGGRGGGLLGGLPGRPPAALGGGGPAGRGLAGGPPAALGRLLPGPSGLAGGLAGGPPADLGRGQPAGHGRLGGPAAALGRLGAGPGRLPSRLAGGP